jgi:hypothetical protein
LIRALLTVTEFRNVITVFRKAKAAFWSSSIKTFERSVYQQIKLTGKLQRKSPEKLLPKNFKDHYSDAAIF